MNSLNGESPKMHNERKKRNRDVRFHVGAVLVTALFLIARRASASDVPTTSSGLRWSAASPTRSKRAGTSRSSLGVRPALREIGSFLRFLRLVAAHPNPANLA